MTGEGQVIFPSQFGRYTLLQRLATGGMAEVFRAKIVSSHGFEKTIVIKRILPNLAADRTFVAMFIDEAKLMAQLTHPKIVQVLDFGEVGGQYFIALEFIDGHDALALLRAAAQKRVRVPLPLVVFLIAEILDALDYAHTASDMDGRPMRLVHRDISPSNIFISRHGDVKLGDFGIAHASDRESRTQAGTLKGKYGYMSPEQVTGVGVDSRSDLFAVGIVLAEAFMGRRLFTARNDLDVLLMVRDGRLERLDRFGGDVTPELDRIVRKALRREVASRFQSAAEFRDVLLDYLYAQQPRVGAPDLRAFMSDLFDPSADATARVQRQGRRLSEPAAHVVSRTPAHGTTPPGGPPIGGGAAVVAADDYASRPVIVSKTPPQPPRGVASASGSPTPPPAASGASGRDAAAARSASEHGRGALAPSPSARATTPVPIAAAGSPLAQALAAADFSLVDLHQWDSAAHAQWDSGAHQASGRVTGWTPVIPPPSRNASGAVAVSGSGSESGRMRLPGARPAPGQFSSAAPARPPDIAGDLGTISPMRIFADLTVAAETGLLRFERPTSAEGAADVRPNAQVNEVKEVFLIAGAPESVSASVPSERFGNYLVSRGVLRPADLELALAKLPQYSGKLGDTLVGLGLMRPLDVFRQLSQQVRDRVIDLFRWSSGTFTFFRNVRNPQESFPLGLDGFEILGTGVLTVPAEQLEVHFVPLAGCRPRRAERRRLDPDAFHLGPTPREVLALLDGATSVSGWLAQFDSADERTTFLRTLYLLTETDLADLD